MYITSFTLKGFKLIDILGNIKRIDVEAKSQIQIIIGTNGSGKSSIMSELSPLPANKNLYFAGGYKKICLIHEGDEYQISSTFEKKAGKHSFVKNNGLELNVNGLSTLQTELCLEYLGYNPLIDDLTHCRYQISRMSPTERKSLILTMAPSIPDFVVQLHKQAKSELRVCKNNLNLLYTRKSIIEEKLVSLEILHQFKTENIELEQQQIKISNDIFLLQNRIAEYQNECNRLGVPRQLDMQVIMTYRKKVQQLLLDSPLKLSIDTVPEILSSLQEQQGQYQQIKLNAENNYQQLQQELNQYDPLLLQGQDTGQQDCLQLIESKMKRLDEIVNYTKLPVIQVEKFDLHEQQYKKLYELFSETWLSEVSYWYPKNNYSKIDRKVNYWDSLLTRINRESNELQFKLQELKKEEDLLLYGPIIHLDNCTTCDYALTYQQRRDKLQDKKKSLITQDKEVKKQLMKIQRVTERFKILHEKMEQQQSYLQQIQAILQPTIWRSSSIDLLDILNGDPQKWLHELKLTLIAQQFHFEKIKLEKDIQQAQSTIEALAKVQVPAIDILKKIYYEKINQLKMYQTDALFAQCELVRIQKHQQYCEQYRKLREAADRILNDIDHYFDYTSLMEYVKYLQSEYLPILMKQKQELDQKIFVITTQLKEQETLRARYTEEITNIIEKIEYRQKVCSYLEMGLSPETGMPHYHILKFINAILENVNFILSQLWTYPFNIELLKEGDEVNCEFVASCNNKQSVALNKLSKSQEAGINFAFYIALVYAVRGTDYPMFFDECDDGFDLKHKQMFLDWLKLYIESQYTPQLWMVYHDVTLYSGFLYKDVICLKKDNISLPQEVNVYTTLTY